MFANKKGEGINTFACAVSLYVAETREATIKDHEPPLPLIPFGIVAYGFAGQRFLKQLYTAWNDGVRWIWINSSLSNNISLRGV